MGMGEEHARDTAARLAFRTDRLDVSGVVGPGVDDPGRIGADDVGVRARQRHRARVGRPQAQ